MRVPAFVPTAAVPGQFKTMGERRWWRRASGWGSWTFFHTAGSAVTRSSLRGQARGRGQCMWYSWPYVDWRARPRWAPSHARRLAVRCVRADGKGVPTLEMNAPLVRTARLQTRDESGSKFCHAFVAHARHPSRARSRTRTQCEDGDSGICRRSCSFVQAPCPPLSLFLFAPHLPRRLHTHKLPRRWPR